MHERRRYARVPDTSEISYEIIPAKKTGRCVIKNLSEGGIKFSVNQLIPQGARLKIKLLLHHTSFAFEIAVRVSWVREVKPEEEYEVGVEFIDLSQRAAECLMEYIETAVARQKWSPSGL